MIGMDRKIRKLSVLVGIFAVMVFAKSGLASNTPSNEGEPIIKVPEEELKGVSAQDDVRLKRLGDFGKFHIFGYGEVHYSAFIGAAPNEIDFHRFTLGLGYDFTDKIIMRAELDFEHAFKEPELEFAYIDFLLKSWLNPRVGAILVPMGVMNEHHEPPLFYSVERPEIYDVIIPTEWQGIGAGFHGQLPAGFDYELYGLSSLTAVSFDNTGGIDQSFNGSEGFHDDHSIGEAPGRDFGAAGRVQYQGVKGLRLGTSFFAGNTGQGNGSIGGGFLTMLEGDARYSFQGFDLEGIFVFSNLSDAGNINNVIVAADPTFNDFVASQMIGWYLEGAYHLFHHMMPDTRQDLIIFSRFENLNTQHKMPSGFAADPANDRRNFTTGISYMPIPQVALKADYNFNWNNANAGVDRFDLGVGFYY